MRYFLFMLVICFAASHPLHAGESAYQQCSQAVQTDPQGALGLAEKWIQKEPHPTAYHCRAMALFALKRYEQAAGALQTLSERMSDSNPVLWGNVVRQHARSWQLAGDKARAITTLSKAISRISSDAFDNAMLGRLSAELLLDRSQLYASGGRELFALQDLDQALSLSADNPKLLLERAKLFAAQKEYNLARRDLERLQAQHPNYPGAAKLAATLR
jgi:tetratricopeptide (TPR) repeat protein